MPPNISNERYRGMFDWWRFSVGDKKELVYSPLTQSTHMLSAGAMQMLQGCKDMDTLDAHASRLCVRDGVGAHRLPEIQRLLEQFVAQGLLASYSDLVARLTKDSPMDVDSATTGIASLVIPTRNRPEALQRCLESYAECAKFYGRDQIKFIVMDQSDESKSQEANLKSVQDVMTKYGIHSQHLTTNDAANFARRLAKNIDVPPEVVNFALLNVYNMPQTHGLSRNFLLLNTIGDVALQVDDDTICRLTPCQEIGSELTLTSQFTPHQFWFLSPSEVDTLGQEGFEREDIFAIHEQLLGRSIASCLESASAPLNLNGITTDFLRRLAKPNCRVAATSVGVAGEAGMEGSWIFLVLEGRARDRLMRSESDYRFALSHHQVLRSVLTPTISSGTLITGHNQGVDNRHFLPPYFPVGRGEDMVFGQLLGLSEQGTFNGYLPWHLLHKPSAPRQYSMEHLLVRISRISFGAILEALLQSFNIGRERSPEKSIESAGKYLADWGRAPLADFEEMLILSLARRTSMHMTNMEAQIKEHGGLPAYWAADVEVCLNSMRQSVGQPNYFVGRDLEDVFGLQEARKMQQVLVGRFGQMLLAWAAIREGASQLRAAGVLASSDG